MSTGTRTWLRALLAVAGGAELLMVAGAAPTLMVVGAIGGVALVVAAVGTWARVPLAVLVVVGTVPLAALAWTALVPVLLLVVVGLVAAPLLRTGSPGSASTPSPPGAAGRRTGSRATP